MKPKATKIVSETHPQFTPELEAGEIVVEVWNATNSPWIFPPLNGERVRNRLVMANLTSQGRLAHSSIARMHDLLGHRLAVNIEARTCRWFDPLVTTPEGRKQWESAQNILNSPEALLHIPKCRLSKDQYFFVDCDDSTIKTWLYWFRRGLESGKVREIQLSVPTFDRIAMLPGKTEIGQLNRLMQGKPQFLEDSPNYEPPAGARELVGAGAGGNGGGSGGGGNRGNKPDGSKGDPKL